jgi:hypothetical protein
MRDGVRLVDGAAGAPGRDTPALRPDYEETAYERTALVLPTPLRREGGENASVTVITDDSTGRL